MSQVEDKVADEPFDAELLHILQHALGLDQYGRGRAYRRHFVTAPGGRDFDACRRLVSLGYMQAHGPRAIAGGDHVFIVTPEGADIVALKSPAPPKVSAGRRRYLDFLEADSPMTFGEWLRCRRATR